MLSTLPSLRVLPVNILSKVRADCILTISCYGLFFLIEHPAEKLILERLQLDQCVAGSSAVPGFDRVSCSN